MRRITTASAILTLLVASASAQQHHSQGPGLSTFRSGVSLVAINVTVSDGKRLVGGLQAGDFTVYEDGVPQDVRFFETATVPLDLMLLIDASASMRDKMTFVHDAATSFMKTLRADDRGAVIVFSSRVDVAQELTSDRSLIEHAIAGIQAEGATALNTALYVALKQFAPRGREASSVRRQAIVVLSDGQDTASALSFDDVLGEARRSGVAFYTISLKAPNEAPRGPAGAWAQADYTMRALATETGGLSFFPTRPSDLKGIYTGIADEIVNQYSIGYSPTNPAEDGRFRRILVRVASRPELRLRARKGYIAAGSAWVSPVPASGDDLHHPAAVR